MRTTSCLTAALLLLATLAQALGQPGPAVTPPRIAPPLPGSAQGGVPGKEVNPDEQKLLAAGLSADGPALVEFFRQRGRRDVDGEAMQAAARRLGDSDSRIRGQAQRLLVGHGATALPALRRLINDLGDAELSSRAGQCIHLIEGEGTHDLPIAAARLLVQRQPAGALEALLAYLPGVETPGVSEEVAAALAALAYPKGQAHPALLTAVTDRSPLRRAVAGAALVRKGQPETWAVPGKLLRDPTALVRLRVGLALAEADDAAAVPVLIDLIAEVGLPRSRQIEELLTHLAGDWAPNPAVTGDDDIARRIRRDAWAGWWRNTDGPMLLAEFRRRMPGPAERDKVLALIEQLSDASSDVRHRAVADLIAFGPRAAPLLREHAQGENEKRVPLAQDVLREIGDKAGKPLPSAAARLLALRRPAGAGELLLDFLPYADETMAAAILSAVTSLPVRDGPLAAVLGQALEDKNPGRRLAAAEVLVKAGSPEQRQSVRRLLRDADLQVRLRAALALAGAADRDAVPVLIDFLALEAAAGAAEAEDFLFRLAGDGVPKLEPATDTAGRRKQRDAWLAWWKTKGSAIDLAALDRQPLLGYTLIVEGNNGNRVYELGRDGKPRWIISNLGFPVDAYVLPGNRVLIAEWNHSRVTERDFKGNILWQRNLSSRPVNTQRLANGHTFIAAQGELLEVDRDGKTVWTQAVPGGVMAAFRSRDGVITRLTNNGQCVRLNLAGKELKTFTYAANGCSSGIDGLANGHVLIAEGNAKVTEMDSEGKVLWQADAPGIASATRLPNGHTLVANNGSNSVTELDRRGKIVWEYKEAPSVFRARRR